MKKRQNSKLLIASIREALQYPLTNPRVVVLRNTSPCDTTMAIINHFYTQPNEFDSYHQLIMSDRYQATRMRSKHKFPMPKSVDPTIAPESTRQTMTVFSASSWIQAMQSKILTARIPLTLILVEGAEYCLHFETILKVAIYAKQEHNIPVRIIWMPAYKTHSLKLKAEQLILNCDDPSAHLPIIFNTTDVTLKSECDCVQPTLLLIQRIHISNKPGNIFVVLPSYLAVRDLMSQLCQLPLKKSYEFIILGYSDTVLPSNGPGALKKIILCTPGNPLLKSYCKVTTLIDAGVRKVARIEKRSRKVTLEYSSKSQMKKIFDHMKLYNQEVAMHVLVTKKTYETLSIYPEKESNLEEFAITLLRLFCSEIPAHEIYSQTPSDWPRYIEAIQYLSEFQLLELSPSTGQYTITNRGRFTLRSELSFRNAQFLFNVLSDSRAWSDKNSFVPYLATITAAWLEQPYNLLIQSNTHAQKIKITEYTREDSLSNALEIYCNYVISFDATKTNRFSWCFNRGIHTPAMKDFFRKVDIIFVAYARVWYFPGELNSLFPPIDTLTSYLDTQFESDKKQLEPYLRSNFSDCLYSKQRPNDENILFPETEEDPDVFYNLTTGKTELLDLYIEPTVVQNIRNPEVQFIATQFELDDQGVERIKKIVIV